LTGPGEWIWYVAMTKTTRAFTLLSHPCLVACLLGCMPLVGCSGPPSEGVGRQVLEQRVRSQSNGKIKLVSFSKTNGVDDKNSYRLEYEAEIEFLSNGSWTSGIDSGSFEFSADAAPGPNSPGAMFALTMGTRDVRQGQREKIKGMMIFEKTEKGWRADGQVY
jgi:hypothetical protein